MNNFKITKNRWLEYYKNCWIIEKDGLYFCKEHDKEFFNFFKTNEIKLILKNYNCFYKKRNNICSVVFFKTQEEAQKFINKILMPYAVIEKLIS